MSEVTETAGVPTNATALWREDGGFSEVGDWHPMLDRIETSGEGVGATRIAHGKDGSVQVERLLSVDSNRRSYCYAIERTTMPVRDYTAEFRIDGIGKRESLLIWSARFELGEGGSNETVENVRTFLHAGLESLKAKYDVGSSAFSP
jgi:mxaD protein